MSLGFTDILLDIFSIRISNKIIIFDDKDAAWITPRVKSAIRRNTRVYRKWVKRGRNLNDHNKVPKVQNSTNKLIMEAKLSYYAKLGNKLSDPLTGHHNFWSAFKRMTSNTQTFTI